MKCFYTILLFTLVGIVLEGTAFLIGIAFTGVRDFGSYWYLAAIYYAGFGPDWLLPSISASSGWRVLYLIVPIVGWALAGVAVTFWMARGRCVGAPVKDKASL
jgi:hypothetical protein